MSFWDSLKKVASGGTNVLERAFAAGSTLVGGLYRDAYNKIPEFRANIGVDVQARIDAKIRLDSADIRQGLEAIGRGLDAVGVGIQTGLSELGTNVGFAGSAIGLGLEVASQRTQDGFLEVAAALRDFDGAGGMTRRVVAELDRKEHELELLAAIKHYAMTLGSPSIGDHYELRIRNESDTAAALSVTCSIGRPLGPASESGNSFDISLVLRNYPQPNNAFGWEQAIILPCLRHPIKAVSTIDVRIPVITMLTAAALEPLAAPDGNPQSRPPKTRVSVDVFRMAGRFEHYCGSSTYEFPRVHGEIPTVRRTAGHLTTDSTGFVPSRGHHVSTIVPVVGTGRAVLGEQQADICPSPGAGDPCGWWKLEKTDNAILSRVSNFIAEVLEEDILIARVMCAGKFERSTLCKGCETAGATVKCKELEGSAVYILSVVELEALKQITAGQYIRVRENKVTSMAESETAAGDIEKLFGEVSPEWESYIDGKDRGGNRIPGLMPLIDSSSSQIQELLAAAEPELRSVPSKSWSIASEIEDDVRAIEKRIRDFEKSGDLDSNTLFVVRIARVTASVELTAPVDYLSCAVVCTWTTDVGLSVQTRTPIVVVDAETVIPLQRPAYKSGRPWRSVIIKVMTNEIDQKKANQYEIGVGQVFLGRLHILGSQLGRNDPTICEIAFPLGRLDLKLKA